MQMHHVADTNDDDTSYVLIIQIQHTQKIIREVQTMYTK